jgi:hypothetical protein
MPLFTRKTTVVAKLETTNGVDATPTGAANAMVIRNVTLNPLDIESVDRALMRAYMGSSPQLVVGQQATLDFEIEIAGAGTSATTAPAYDCLLQACGLLGIANGTTSFDYSPVSGGFKSVTLYTYIDGIKHAIVGAMGTVDFDMTAKAIPVMKFKFKGVYAAPIDSGVGTVAYTGWQTPLGVNNVNTSGFALHGYPAILQSLQISMGNNVIHRNMVGADYFTITDRAVSGSVTIEMPTTVAAKDWFSIALAMTQAALTITHGTQAFNKFKVSSSSCQLLKPTYGDQDGIRMLQMGLMFVPTGNGNNEITFSTL